MFGRATITLGIGSHSSYGIFVQDIACRFFVPKLDWNSNKSNIFVISQPAFDRGQPNFYLKYIHMSYMSMPIFVKFGLLSTTWEFFKLRWCLHRRHGKCPLYACAFSLSCCCLKHLHLAGRPSCGISMPHLLVPFLLRIDPLYFQAVRGDPTWAFLVVLVYHIVFLCFWCTIICVLLA